MAKRKRKDRRQQVPMTPQEFAQVLSLTLQQYSIQGQVAVAGPFVGLTFAISGSVDGKELVDALIDVSSAMLAPLMTLEQVEKLQREGYRLSPSGSLHGTQSSAN